MKLMIDDAVWGFAEIFSEFGEVITLPGREINRQSLIDCEILIILFQVMFEIHSGE